MLNKYFVSKEKINKTHEELNIILTRLNSLHYDKDLMSAKTFNYTTYISLEQFIKLNPDYMHALEKPEFYYPKATLTNTNYAYLYIPDYLGFHMEESGDEENYDKFSFIILHLANKLSKMNPVGWIFDLRGNTGGIIYSFVLGFISLLDDFVVKCKDINGETKCNLVCEDNDLYYQYIGSKKKTIGLMPPISKIKISNVHILIDGNTSSCGELLCYLLKKQHNAIIYGSPSYGLSSWMDYYDIPGYEDLFDDLSFRYPELIFDFTDCDIKLKKIKSNTNTPILSIIPDKENIPFEEFGMF